MILLVSALTCESLTVSVAAGAVPHADRLLLVCDQRWETSERLLGAQQDAGVFRYWGETVWSKELFSLES